MKKIILFTIALITSISIYAQSNYHPEYDYSKFNGKWNHEGGVAFQINFDGNYFLIKDLLGEKVQGTFKGYPDKGRIKYSIGNNEYEYISFSKDYENVLLVGQWNYEYYSGSTYIIRKKELTLSDLNTINKYLGQWNGKSYPDISESCKIELKESKLIYTDLKKNTKCDLFLTDNKNLIGEIKYNGNEFAESFKLFFDENDNLKYESYQKNIEFKK